MSKAAVGFYVGTDTQVTLQGLKDVLGAYVNDAVVSGVLQNKQGMAIIGGSVPFNYVAGTNGNYVGDLSASAAIVANTEYDLMITATRTNRTITLKVSRTAGYLTA
jgi:hypothetical protein